MDTKLPQYKLNQNVPDSVSIHPLESPLKPWFCAHLDFAGPYLGKDVFNFNKRIFEMVRRF